MVAVIAPVIVSLAMWAVTRSPFALMFAAFGPVMAIAGYVDAGLGGRRRHRAARRRFVAELEQAEEAVRRAHTIERRRRWAEHPAASQIVETGRTDARWRMPAESASRVSIGAGAGASTLVLDGGVPPGATADGDGAATAELTRTASIVEDVPVLVDARHGIGVVGPAVLARAVARGLVIQLAHAAGPDALELVTLPDAGWDALADLPHALRRAHAPSSTGGMSRRVTASVLEYSTSSPSGVVRTDRSRATGTDADLRIVIAPSVADLPSSCTEIVECRSPLRVVWRRADSLDEVEAVPEPVSVPDATRFSTAMASDAVALGMSPRSSEPPSSLRFDELPLADVRPGRGLAVPIGATAHGPLVVDLVGDGPHAVIGGTTGSGKSELLITWATSLAASTTPEHLSLLLFDFKGGATFGEVVGLPHVVGLVTDLDEATADRALASLRAELRQRERLLHEAGVRDLKDARPGSIARLVIVVDEFAAMIESFPDLHGVFVDLAARGRSLGVHLVLCTQRPAAAVRDGVLANCDIRISLRVNNAGDSIAVVGTPDAAALPSSQPGRVVASLAGRPPLLAQVAATTATDVQGVGRAASGSTSRRPWLDPLPARVGLDTLDRPETGFVLGRFDLPAEQSQPTAVYDPASDGHMLVLGSSGRGSSTLLDVLEEQRVDGWSVVRIPTDPEGAWDALQELSARSLSATASTPVERCLVLLDDLDVLIARWGEEYGRSARTALVEVLRSGPAGGVYVVLTAHRATADVLVLGDLVGSTVRLGSTSRNEHVLSGAESSSFRPDRRPGSGVWLGRELQVACLEAGAPRERRGAPAGPAAVRVEPGLTMVVTRRPVERARSARERDDAEVVVLGAERGSLRIDDVTAPSGSTVVVGDLDAWQQQWALLTALRTTATVVVEDASAAEFRSLTRRNELPPWIEAGAGRAWVVRPGLPVTRARFEATQRDDRGGARRGRPPRDVPGSGRSRERRDAP
ncbi:FtsK/SpoIIIE domain-containing protein [Labedella endophytica]|uniref:FtsK/SpoIIIE domain-containing protein n=1 Tax=Labedella endophytica TaxID=1523160 RepID=UPI001407731C|nr:FtsK/SpoIIIE domain-containing protein [Labedella endophytica]